jgi:hypothetical protein
MVGDIQATRDGEIESPAISMTKPMPTWDLWRRTIDPNGTEPSSRRCGFQPVSRPNRKCIT